MRYIDEFLGLTVAPLLLEQSLFPNSKEITESFGLFNAVREHVRPKLNLSFKDDSFGIVVVGDGHTPRTAATFATRSNWQTYSIDPLLNKLEWKILRVECLMKKVQDVSHHFSPRNILVLPHAHVSIQDCLCVVPRVAAIVAMPCCFPMEMDVAPDIEYRDEQILSPCNLIKIWFPFCLNND